MPETGYFDTREQAIAAWNNRADIASLESALKTLAEAACNEQKDLHATVCDGSGCVINCEALRSALALPEVKRVLEEP